ncbi:MAG: TrkA family potassium uptake protein [Clostridia bacterium]|nr:TrkA family potassium uptake protein [Clostridia bacterium]
MKSVLVIGMGRFGQHLALKMQELGNDVMIIDRNEKIINELAPRFTDSHIGDCTSESVLRALDVASLDLCFVAMGEDFQSSLVVTSLLKRAGAKCVIAKANHEIQADLLKQIGADEVVYPEREIAEKLAVRYNEDNIFDYLQLTAEYSIYEVPVLSSWVGQSLAGLDIRRKYNINIIAIKQGSVLQPTPTPDYIFAETDHVVVIGKSTDVFKLTSK